MRRYCEDMRHYKSSLTIEHSHHQAHMSIRGLQMQHEQYS